MAVTVDLFVGNDMDVEVTLTERVSGNPINNATVTVQVKDRFDTNIMQPSALSYVTGSNGVYRGQIDNDVPLEVNKWHIVEIKAVSEDSGDTLDGLWRIRTKAKNRTS